MFCLRNQDITDAKAFFYLFFMSNSGYPYIHAGWHMNKKHWISIYEDENVDSDLVIDLVHSSYELVVSKLNKLQRQRIAALKAIT